MSLFWVKRASCHSGERVTALYQSSAKLFTYTGESIPVLGTTDIRVDLNGQTATLPLLVTRGKGPSLLGWNWLSAVQLNWKEILTIHLGKNWSLQSVLDAHSNVFADGLTGPHSECQSLKVMAVFTSVGNIRSPSTEQWKLVDQYPIPKIFDLIASLPGGNKFTKLDLSHTYQQIPLDEASQLLVTINTHKGIHKSNRHPLVFLLAQWYLREWWRPCCRGFLVSVYTSTAFWHWPIRRSTLGTPSRGA